MKHIALFSVLLLLAVAGGCSHNFEYRVSDSVFIEDSQNPGLPVYSEKGYNSFGVYWGLSLFTTRFSLNPSKVVVQNDSCHIHFSGSVHQDSYTLVVSLPGYTPAAYSELLALGGKQFNLPAEDCILTLLSGSRQMEVKLLNGEFTVKRAQNMSIDMELESVVLSGTFSFKATIDGEAVSFSKGRFDMRFGDDNFFYLQED